MMCRWKKKKEKEAQKTDEKWNIIKTGEKKGEEKIEKNKKMNYGWY